MKRISAFVVAGLVLSWAATAVADEASDRVAAAGTAALGGSQAAMYRINQKVWDRDTAARDARVKAAGSAAMGGSQSAMYAMDATAAERAMQETATDEASPKVAEGTERK